MITITNINAVWNNGYSHPAVEYDVDGRRYEDFLDDTTWDFIAEDHEIALRNDFTVEQVAEIRKQLGTWLAEISEISVAVNGTPEFFVLTVPAKADAYFIREVIEVENFRIGGSDCGEIYDGHNGVRVFRDDEEVLELRQEEKPRRQAA
jgi:hypothetical protein